MSRELPRPSPEGTRDRPSLPLLYPVAAPVTMLAFRTLCRLLGGWRVEGREHVPEEGGVLFAPNHTSYLDPVAVGTAVRRRCWFMAKEPVFRVPVLGPLIRLYLAFPVKVGGAIDRAALRKAEGLLTSGEAVCVFPEGTVNRGPGLNPLQPGLALLSLRTGAPVIPTAVVGIDRTIPPPHSIPRPARGGVTVRFGRPLRPERWQDEGGRREQADRMTVAVAAALAELLPPERGGIWQDPARPVEPRRPAGG